MNDTVLAMTPRMFGLQKPPACRTVKENVTIPLSWDAYYEFWGPLKQLQLRWDYPDCRNCEGEGKLCGFSNDSGQDISCSNPPSKAVEDSDDLLSTSLEAGQHCILFRSCCMLETSESILSADHETVKIKITIAVLYQCRRQGKWITTHAIRCLVQYIYSPNITYSIAPKSQNSKFMPLTTLLCQHLLSTQQLHFVQKEADLPSLPGIMEMTENHMTYIFRTMKLPTKYEDRK